MAATAVSLVINDDLTAEQMKTILTNRMNILVSVKEVSDEHDATIGVHFHIQAEVESPDMLKGILEVLLHAITSGEPAFEGSAPRGESEAKIDGILADYRASKES